jgi:CHAT domain-containing protein/tetratricopeptide (TPR) repeat protein
MKSKLLAAAVGLFVAPLSIFMEILTEQGAIAAEPSLVQTAPTNEASGFQLMIEGRKQLQNGDPNRALDLFRQAIAAFRKSGDIFSEARTFNLIGDANLLKKDAKAAIASYEQSLQVIQDLLLKAGNLPPENLQVVRQEEVVVLQNLAYTLNLVNDVPRAIAMYELATAKAEAVNLGNRQVAILNSLGYIYIESGNPSKGLELSQKALNINQSLANPNNSLVILINIGYAYRQLGRSDQALDFYRQAEKIAQADKNISVLSSIFNNIATIYLSQGKYAQALESYKSSLKLAEEASEFRKAAITGSNIGSVYKAIGQYDRALEYYQKALQEVKRLGDRQSESVFLNNIGSIYNDKGQVQRSLDYYQQAYKIHLELKDLPAQAKTLNNIALAHSELRQHAQALETYSQVLALLKKANNLSTEAIALGNIGGIYVNLKRYPEAINLYQQAATIHQQLGERAGESVVLSQLGRLFASTNQPELAILFYKQSVNLREQLRKELRSLSQAEQKIFTGKVAQTYRELADILLKQNRVLEAQQVLDLLKVQELDDYLKNVRGNAKTATGISLLDPERRFLSDYNAIQNRMIQSSQEAIEILKITPESRTTAQSQKLQELIQIQERSSQQLNTYIQNPAVVSILQQVTGAGSGEVNLQQFASLQNNLQELSQKSAILYPLILEDRLELILVPAKGDVIRRTVNVKREAINQLIVNFRSEVRDPSSLDVLDSSQQLYQWLIAPIAADLQKAGVETIIYAPDGQLRYLPIAALHDGKQWLVERYAINTITAASLTKLSDRRSNQPLRVLAGAFITGRYIFEVNGEIFNFAGLPFAGKEIENLTDKLPNSIKLVDQNFSVKSTVDKFKNYNIIHLATHAAFVSGEPEDSFVLFGDGSRASLRDVATWSLQNVDLVILSACETGLGGRLGNGTEIMGFGYQMEYAGAKAAIASLWQVSDGGTQALMDRFYNILPKPQITKAAVLAKAQRSLISSAGEFSHPYYWSPFILIGNGL